MGAGDEVVEREFGLRSGCVEDASGFVGSAVEEERREIAGVDEAREPGWWRGDDECVLGGEHAGPPGDTIGRIVGASDDARARDAVRIWEGFDDDLFAEDFEPAVGFAGDFFDGWIIECDLWTVFVEDDISVSYVVDGDRGDKDVEIGVVFEQIARGFGDAGGVAAHVDDGVEVLTSIEELFDSVEPVTDLWVAIADESTDGGGESWIFFGSVEECDGVVRVNSELGEGTAGELGAAEDEDVHA